MALMKTSLVEVNMHCLPNCNKSLVNTSWRELQQNLQRRKIVTDACYEIRQSADPLYTDTMESPTLTVPALKNWCR